MFDTDPSHGPGRGLRPLDEVWWSHMLELCPCLDSQGAREETEKGVSCVYHWPVGGAKGRAIGKTGRGKATETLIVGKGVGPSREQWGCEKSVAAVADGREWRPLVSAIGTLQTARAAEQGGGCRSRRAPHGRPPLCTVDAHSGEGRAAAVESACCWSVCAACLAEDACDTLVC